MKGHRIAVLTGATAAGKTRAALDLAHALEKRGRRPLVISADSVQVYQFMDVGSDKLPLERREGVPHFLIDVAHPRDTYSAAQFSKAADQIIEDAAPDEVPIVVGGTGFYLRTLLWGLFAGPARDQQLRDRLYQEADELGVEALHQRLREADPEAADRVHPHDHVRVVRALEILELTGKPISEHFRDQAQPTLRHPALVIGLDLDRKKMYEKIDERAARMIELGLIEEVKGLREMGCGPELESQKALGYRQVHMMLDGEIGRDRAVELIQRDTRRFARRQLTWLRKEPGLVWLPVEQTGEVIGRCLRYVEEEP